MSNSSRLQGYKDILMEAEGLPQSEARDSSILAIKKIIRNEELSAFRRHYSERGCYFGYLLLQSQVFEEQIRDIIRLCVSIISKKGMSRPLYPYKKKQLDDMTLGELLEPLKYYVGYEKLITRLSSFNQFRKKVIHRLVSDYDVELATLESKIVNDKLKNEHEQTLYMALEVSRRASGLLAELNSVSDPMFEATFEQLKTELNLESEPIELKV
jgi:hypothetical protein